MSIDQVPGAIASAYCQIAQTCYGDFYSFVYSNVDCKQLVTSQITEKDLPNWNSLISKGTVTYHGENVQACIDAIAAEGCSATSSRTPQICASAIEGTVAAGGDCSFDAECVYGNYCKSGGTCPGKCTAWESLGNACTSSDHCVSGANCYSGTCQKPVAEGGACQGGKADCDVGLYCKGGTSAKSGTCSKLSDVFGATEGQTCDLTKLSMCKPPASCVVDSVSGTTMVTTCHAELQSGADCHLGFPDPCPSAEYCKIGTTNAYTGTCTKLPVAGEACNTQKDAAVCAPGLHCTKSKCVEMQKDGGTCVTGADCYSETCTSGSCTAAAACQ
jgi:hypothetical protein